MKVLRALGDIRIQRLAAAAIISVVLAMLAFPYIPQESIYAQSVGSGGVPGKGAGAVTVASAVVPNANVTIPAVAVYTPATAGIYRICGGYLVTSAGSTGATLEGYASFYNAGIGHQPVLGGAAEAAVALGASGAGYGQNTCITALTDANKAIGIGFIVGGSPATNPIYTYWYTVTQL